jgi:NADH-quinone oxidoreductase subunit M
MGTAPAFAHPALLAAISATAVILAAVYLFTMFQKVMLGPLDKPENRDEHVRDLSWNEKLVFAVIVVMALGMGFAPGPILSRSSASVDAMLTNYRGRLAEARSKPEAPARMLGQGGGPRRPFGPIPSRHGGGQP